MENQGIRVRKGKNREIQGKTGKTGKNGVKGVKKENRKQGNSWKNRE